MLLLMQYEWSLTMLTVTHWFSVTVTVVTEPFPDGDSQRT